MIFSRLKKFVKPTPKSAFVGIDAIILIGTTIAFAGVFALVSTQIAGMLLENYIDIAFVVPKFHSYDALTGAIEPTSILAVYTLIKKAIFEKAFFIFLVLIGIFAITDAVKLTQNKAKPLIFKTIFAGILVSILPGVWDPVALQIEHGAIWLLNPTYSFNPDKPCVLIDSPEIAAIAKENKKIVDDLRGVFTIGMNQTGLDQLACYPSLRINYIFEKAMHGASFQTPEDLSAIEKFWSVLSSYAESIMAGIWGGITKAMTLSFTVLFSTIVMVGKNLWLMVLMALFPLLVVFSLAPYVGEFASKLLKMIVPLLMTTILTAGIILAGSSALQLMEDNINNGRSLYGFSTMIDLPGAHPGDSNTPKIFDQRTIFWIAAVTTLGLAAIVPVMVVPQLGSFANMVGQMVGTAVLSGTMGVLSTARGTIGGGGQALKGEFAANTAKGMTSGQALFGALGSKSVYHGAGTGLGRGLEAGLYQDAAVGLTSGASFADMSMPHLARPLMRAADDRLSRVNIADSVKDHASSRNAEESANSACENFKNERTNWSEQTSQESQTGEPQKRNPSDDDVRKVARTVVGTKNNYRWRGDYDLVSDKTKQKLEAEIKEHLSNPNSKLAKDYDLQMNMNSMQKGNSEHGATPKITVDVNAMNQADALVQNMGNANSKEAFNQFGAVAEAVNAKYAKIIQTGISQTSASDFVAETYR